MCLILHVVSDLFPVFIKWRFLYLRGVRLSEVSFFGDVAAQQNGGNHDENLNDGDSDTNSSDLPHVVLHELFACINAAYSVDVLLLGVAFVSFHLATALRGKSAVVSRLVAPGGGFPLFVSSGSTAFFLLLEPVDGFDHGFGSSIGVFSSVAGVYDFLQVVG